MFARRSYHVCLGAAWLLCVVAFASCYTSGTAFHHPLDFNNVRADVLMKDSTQLTGYFSYTEQKHPTRAMLWMPGERKNIVLNLQDVEYYTTDMGRYEQKLLHISNRGSTAKHKPFTAFVKKLTADDALVQLYEHEERVPLQKAPRVSTVKKYYASLPGRNSNELWDIEGEQFNPGFNEKMLKLFAADTSIIQLIEQKDKRYYNTAFNLRSYDKLRVLMNLNKDYKPAATSPHSHAAN